MWEPQICTHVRQKGVQSRDWHLNEGSLVGLSPFKPVASDSLILGGWCQNGIGL